MQANAGLSIGGRARVWHWRGDRLLSYAVYDNLVVTAGKDLVANIVENNSGTPVAPSHMALGDGALATDAGQTALQGTEHANPGRITVATTRVTNVVTYTATLTNTSGGVITVNEVGIFNAAAAGTMLARFLSNSFDMANNDALTIAWSLTYG